MPFIPDPSRIEVLEPEWAAVLRSKSPAERLAIAFDANRTMRLRIAGHLQTVHPEWTDEQVSSEVARRMLYGTD